MQTTITNTYSKLVDDLLLRVQKPGQYLGIELGHLIENEAEKQRSKDKKNFFIIFQLIHKEAHLLSIPNWQVQAGSLTNFPDIFVLNPCFVVLHLKHLLVKACLVYILL